MVWSLLAILALKYFFLPWRDVVGDNTVVVLVLLVVPTFLIFCCSSSEAALLQPGALSPATQSVEPSKHQLVRIFQRRIQTGYTEVAADRELANGMIVLVNTILAIGMTVGIQHTLAQNPTNSLNGDAFTGYGVTVLLFLLGEMLPKQMALSKDKKWQNRAVSIGRAGIAFFYVTALVHFVASGIVDTLQWRFNENKT
jgi:CBS domain containing-hemolysin-like protein